MAQTVRAAPSIEPMPGPPEGEVELGQVERELAALWAPERSGAVGTLPGGAEVPAVLRACALNLLVLGQSPADLERARPVAARTTLAHPSRILLLAPIPGNLDGIGARISAFCHRLGSGGRHVCCEEITVLARGLAAGRIPEAVLPLLLPDMPIHLWIPDGEERDADPRPATPRTSITAAGSLAAVSLRLAELADAVIWSARGPEDVLPVSPTRSRPVVVVDLDWLRILPWRELTAQLFDSPDRRVLLERLESAEVIVAGSPGARPAAGWLWLGWLAARLGWRSVEEAAGGSPVGAEGSRRTARAERPLQGPGGVVTIRLRWEESSAAARGELLAVRLVPRGADEPLVLKRHCSPDPADLWISDGASRCVHLGERDEAVLLGEALDRTAPDPIYDAAWQKAVELWRGG